jgi:hypothetical protein
VTRPVVLVAVATCAAACFGAIPHLAEPEHTPRVQHVRLASGALVDLRRVGVEVWAVRAVPTGAAADLAATVLPASTGAPFRGASSLPAGSRWWHGSAARELQTALHTTVGQASQHLGAEVAFVGTSLHTVVTTAGGVELELTGDGRDGVIVRVRSHPNAPIDLPVAQPLTTAAPGALFVPAATSTIAGHVAFVLPADAASPDERTHLEALAAPLPTTAALTPRPEPEAWRLARRAIGADNRRQALLALAIPLRVPRAIDLLLVADERALVEATTALPARAGDDRAWPFELAVWTALLSRLERDDLPAALQATMLRHLGAVAADAPALRQCLARAADGDHFALLLHEENKAALGDRQAAHRVRAQDWLQERGIVVPGFEALDPPATRRAALRAYLAAARDPGAGR